MLAQSALEPDAADDAASAAWRSTVRRRLRAWFRRTARPLPWREDRDPYRVWISEIMLQQTQVRTVEPYFQRFLAELPTIEGLAAADLQQVLKLWEGLGYYRRARQLHAAARQIVRDHGGQFPRTAAEVLALPGIGRYTAGAILSIAFDAREPILEANTVRLLARLMAFRGDPASTSGQKQLWWLAEALLPRHDSGTINQALMELGSLVCLPRDPRCDECPMHGLCPTARDGLQHLIPRRKARPQVEQVRQAAVVVRRGRRVLLVLRGPHERWAGMWDFPRFELKALAPAAVRRELAEQVAALYGVRIADPRLLTTIRHSVTRFRITLSCFEASAATTATRLPTDTRRWVSPSELTAVPLCSSARRLAVHLAQRPAAIAPGSARGSRRAALGRSAL